MLRQPVSILLRAPPAARCLRLRFTSTLTPIPAPLAKGRWGRTLLSLGAIGGALGGTALIVHKIYNKSPSTVPDQFGILTTGTAVGDLTSATSPSDALPDDDDDGKNTPFSPAVRDHLHATYAHAAGGLGITAAMCFGLRRIRAVRHIMARSPVGFVCSFFAASYVTLTVAHIPEAASKWKYAAWGTFYGTAAAMLAPLLHLYPPALLAKAGVYTIGVVGGLSYLGLTAERDKYLHISTPVFAIVGLTAVAGTLNFMAAAYTTSTALGALVAQTTLMLTGKIIQYGVPAYFAGDLLQQTHRIIDSAESADALGKPFPAPIDDAGVLIMGILQVFGAIVAGADIGKKPNTR
ncbi:hypothetical protein HDU87_007686 [Geranomyces variabilis]|uniref:Uncharacterized protein n=1 Tax=Geranomyces variabilis TaxID=109894 RepID=A0AAD5XML5_9FUNG|nr:hypothetical protein HDU87_007686 [Geranomyces variabilis]